MKKFLSTALAFTLLVGAAQAQEEGHGKRGGKHGDMFKELNLTAEQQTKIKNIREAEKTEMKSLKSDGKTDANKEAWKAAHEKYKTQIDGVLTTEQKAKLKETRKGGDDRMGKGDRKEGRQFGKNLDLNADQKTKVASLNSDFKTRMEAIKSNTALSQEQKKEQFRQLADAHKNALKGVLTKEQVAKMEEARKAHKGPKSKNL